MAHFMRTSFTGPIPNNPEDLPDWLASNCGVVRTRDVKLSLRTGVISGAGSGTRYATAYIQVKNDLSENVGSIHLVRLWFSDSSNVFKNGTSDLQDESVNASLKTPYADTVWLITNSNGAAWKKVAHDLVNMDSVLSGASQQSNKKSISAEAHATMLGTHGGVKTQTWVLTNGNWQP